MNKIAVVTGAYSGIGKAVVNKLENEKVLVIKVDIDTHISSLPNGFCLDVSDEASARDFCSQISKEYDHVDYLVNSAGIFCDKNRNTIEKTEVSELLKLYEVNFIGSFLMIKHLLPLLKLAESPSVVNISSDQTFKARTKGLPYVASKAAVNELVKVAALEYLDSNIRFNAVAAASVKTNFIRKYYGSETDDIYKSQNEKMPFGLIAPEQVAEMVCFLLGDKSKNITGQIILVDSGVCL